MWGFIFEERGRVGGVGGGHYTRDNNKINTFNLAISTFFSCNAKLLQVTIAAQQLMTLHAQSNGQICRFHHCNVFWKKQKDMLTQQSRFGDASETIEHILNGLSKVVAPAPKKKKKKICFQLRLK